MLLDIGLEMVEALVSRGLKVTLVEAQPQVLPHLDAEMAVPLLEEMKLRGVQVHVATSVTALRASANVAVGAVEVQTSASENWLTADFIIMAGTKDRRNREFHFREFHGKIT